MAWGCRYNFWSGYDLTWANSLPLYLFLDVNQFTLSQIICLLQGQVSLEFLVRHTSKRCDFLISSLWCDDTCFLSRLTLESVLLLKLFGSLIFNPTVSWVSATVWPFSATTKLLTHKKNANVSLLSLILRLEFLSRIDTKAPIWVEVEWLVIIPCSLDQLVWRRSRLKILIARTDIVYHDPLNVVVTVAAAASMNPVLNCTVLTLSRRDQEWRWNLCLLGGCSSSLAIWIIILVQTEIQCLQLHGVVSSLVSICLGLSDTPAKFKQFRWNCPVSELFSSEISWPFFGICRFLSLQLLFSEVNFRRLCCSNITLLLSTSTFFTTCRLAVR